MLVSIHEQRGVYTPKQMKPMHVKSTFERPSLEEQKHSDESFIPSQSVHISITLVDETNVKPETKSQHNLFAHPVIFRGVCEFLRVEQVTNYIRTCRQAKLFEVETQLWEMLCFRDFHITNRKYPRLPGYLSPPPLSQEMDRVYSPRALRAHRPISLARRMDQEPNQVIVLGSSCSINLGDPNCIPGGAPSPRKVYKNAAGQCNSGGVRQTGEEEDRTARERRRIQIRRDRVIQTLEWLDWKLFHVLVGPCLMVFGYFFQRDLHVPASTKLGPFIMFSPIFVLLALLLISIGTGLLLYRRRFVTTSTLHGLWYFNTGILHSRMYQHMNRPKTVIGMICTSWFFVATSVALIVYKIHVQNEQLREVELYWSLLTNPEDVPLFWSKSDTRQALSWQSALLPAEIAIVLLSGPSFFKLLTSRFEPNSTLSLVPTVFGIPTLGFLVLLGPYLDQRINVTLFDVFTPIWVLAGFLLAYPFLMCAAIVAMRRNGLVNQFLEGCVIIGTLFPSMSFCYLISLYIDTQGARVSKQLPFTSLYMVLGLITLLLLLSSGQATTYPRLSVVRRPTANAVIEHVTHDRTSVQPRQATQQEAPIRERNNNADSGDSENQQPRINVDSQTSASEHSNQVVATA